MVVVTVGLAAGGIAVPPVPTIAFKYGSYTTLAVFFAADEEADLRVFMSSDEATEVVDFDFSARVADCFFLTRPAPPRP